MTTRTFAASLITLLLQILVASLLASHPLLAMRGWVGQAETTLGAREA